MALPPRGRARGRKRVNSKKVKCDGFTFDSGLEHGRYLHLKRLEEAGLIKDLEVHPSWMLRINGRAVLTPKTKQQARITLDFMYMDYRGDVVTRVIEDTKGRATDLALFKISVWEAMTGWTCEIVTRENQ